MENKTSTFSKILFSLTVAFLVTACVMFIISSFAVRDDGGFMKSNAFGSLIYWILTISGGIWYVYRFGFPKARKAPDEGEKTYLVLLSVFVPLLIGMGMALVVYYAFYGLLLLLMASLGYVVTVALIAGLFFAVRFLINLYFKPTDNNTQQTWLVILSLLLSIGLLIIAFYATEALRSGIQP